MQLGDGTPITPVDIQTRVGTFPPNFVQELASGQKKLHVDKTTIAGAAAEEKKVEIEDVNLATLDFGELLKVATELQRSVKAHKQVNLDLLEEQDIAQHERIIAVRFSLPSPRLVPCWSVRVEMYTPARFETVQFA